MELDMKRLASVLIALSLFVVSSARAQDVRYNFDKDTDFSNYKTYKWVELKNAEKLDDLTAKEITSAMDAALAQKGLTKVDSDDADLFVGYQAAVGQEKQFTSYSNDWGYGGGWYRGGWYGGGMGSTTTTGQTSTIYNGQLALDMYDSKKHSLV